jgi:acetyl-CoA carboxylase carboxyl transferase subunit alpha
LGGAHRDIDEMARRIGEHVSGQLDALCATDTDGLVEARYQRLMAYGSV